jgi:protein dithiol oxidoreductase (disulfide-forming)
VARVKLGRALWLAAALLLGGCGGGGSPEPATEDGTAATTEAPAQADAPELLSSDPGGVESAGHFQLGTHYLRLSPTQPTSSPPDKIEVGEVFWYGCPHCFRFDPLLERWRATAPEYVSFVRVPAVWNSLLKLHARAFYTAEALGKGAEMHGAFFSEIHERGNALDSEAKLQEFFGRFGVDAETFKKTFESFAVQEKLQRADELNRRYRIGSVPTIVVNGKYTSDATLTGSYEDLLALVDELVAAEHAGQQ